MAKFERRTFQVSRDNVSPYCDLKKMDILIKERVMIPNSAIRPGEYTWSQSQSSCKPFDASHFDNAAILQVSKILL